MILAIPAEGIAAAVPVSRVVSAFFGQLVTFTDQERAVIEALDMSPDDLRGLAAHWRVVNGSSLFVKWPKRISRYSPPPSLLQIARPLDLLGWRG